MSNERVPAWEIYCYACICSKCKCKDIYVGKAKWGTLDRDKSHRKAAKRIQRGKANKGDIKFDHLMARHGLETSTFEQWQNVIRSMP